jgi:hypothetical protein
VLVNPLPQGHLALVGHHVELVLDAVGRVDRESAGLEGVVLPPSMGVGRGGVKHGHNEIA